MEDKLKAFYEGCKFEEDDPALPLCIDYEKAMQNFNDYCDSLKLNKEQRGKMIDLVSGITMNWAKIRALEGNQVIDSRKVS